MPYIAKALAISELSKSHATILFLATEAFDVLIAVVTLNTSTQGMLWKMVYRLRKDQFAVVHGYAHPYCYLMVELEVNGVDSSSR